MSLARTALRLAAILALSRNFTAPFPTIARDRVFDSRLDPIQAQAPDDAIPTIVVYTDDDQGEPLSSNNGGPPFSRIVTLVLELNVGVLQASDVPGAFTYGLPETDAELEATLDLFEYQVRFALADPTNPWAVLLLSRFLIRIVEWTSARMVTSEGNIRLAARQITARVEIRDDDLPLPYFDGNPPALPPNIQALLDAIGEAPATHVQPLVALLQQSGMPSAVQMDALKTIWMQTVPPSGTQEIVAVVEDLDTADTADTADTGD